MCNDKDSNKNLIEHLISKVTNVFIPSTSFVLESKIDLNKSKINDSVVEQATCYHPHHFNDPTKGKVFFL